MKKKNRCATALAGSVLLLFLLLSNATVNAQLKGDHLLGDFGLDAGTQAPPTIIAAMPFYWYNASRLKNNDGDVLTNNLDVGAFLFGVGGSVVTNFKILNANYGASILFPFMSDRMEGNKIQSFGALGFTDMYVQPIQLGWHLKKADFTAGYGIYMPTGKYEYGGDDNKGMGMWTHEFSAGTTIFFDPGKTFNISSIVFFETHSKKKDADARVGNIISISGGVRKAFYKKLEGFPLPIVFNAGPIYYMQFKVSDDRIPVGSNIFTGKRDQIYAWGLEFNALHPKIRTSLSLRWYDEFGGRNRFEGNTFFITLGYILKSLAKGPQAP